MAFFDSYIGMFITQSVLHSLITVIIIEMSFYSWEIKDHLTKFRYRLLVLTLPIFMFPVYQLINPGRGSMYFRENAAIFNINKWLAIKIWDFIPLYALFFLLLLLTAAVFILQEILPIVTERLLRLNHKREPASDNGSSSIKDVDLIINELSGKLNIKSPSVRIVDEPHPVLFTTGLKNYTIILSNALVDKFNPDELESALAHEIVHMLRGSSIKTQIIYLVRMLMFYNPISLIEFRRLVQDDEFICDNATISLTKKPEALIAALKIFYSRPIEDARSKISLIKDIIESHSHNLLLHERIVRMQEEGFAENIRFGWSRYILTSIIILNINYMVV